MGEGFRKPHIDLFERWAGPVTGIASVSRCPLPRGYKLAGDLKGEPLDDQAVPHGSIPPGSIDPFEGTVLCFRPKGDLAWEHRYPPRNLR